MKLTMCMSARSASLTEFHDEICDVIVMQGFLDPAVRVWCIDAISCGGVLSLGLSCCHASII
eukprot:3622749-Amphidinium_carterae.1